ncbi:MAG TPA: serine hydrolase domain-containing protein [Gemmatimonadaceae bacterium]|nr:serine hydrolase domain-containing protein [Gemmatimonadaceae bacterium]
MRSLAMLLSVFTVVAACATGGHPVLPDIDPLMQRYDGAVPGVSLLVMKDGVPVVRRSWGMSDLEQNIPATPETNFRLASITKQFTAAAILLLVQDRKVSLDDPISRWLPSLPTSTAPVTIRHLLSHTSGIVDYEDVMAPETSTQLLDADVLRLVEKHDSTYFKPGTGYRYSNSGYALLALIVERASGKTFAAFLRDRIFAPLGMMRTVAHQEGASVVDRRAFGYTSKNGTWLRKDQSTTSAVLGDGGIYSSIDDLAKWDAALYDSRLLSDESRRAAFTAHTSTDDPNIKYGFGWRISGQMLWHSGETSGFRNVILQFPAKRLTVVMLSNRDDPEPYDTALKIAKMFGQ